MGTPVSDQRHCNRMRLWEFPDQYVLEPLEGGHSQLLSINRTGGEVNVIDALPTSDVSGDSIQTATVFGLVGVQRLLAGVYALVITAREYVGCYRGSSIYKILSMKFLHCDSDSKPLTASERKGEAHLRSLLKSIEATQGLYLSYGVDLTNNAQKAYDLTSTHKNQPLWKQAESRFLWNKQFLEELIDAKLESFALPIIQGSFQTLQVQLEKENVNVTLIARRCVRRIGTRMWRRGANLEGDVANFVESEQILEAKGHVASYVQVRGSIPVLWQQVVDLSYKPKIQLSNLDESPKVLERHFQDLVHRYGSVVAIDLVNQKGSESVLSMAYGNAMQNIVNENIRYVPFDFHHICGQIRFDKLSILYEQVADQLEKQRFFLITDEGFKIEEQKGVVRTNCIDCLDRTNVTQSLLGRKSLEAQLQRLGLFGPAETISQHHKFDEKFKVLWADHGDNISIQYSGTSALKGDFVRHGKRTVYGILKDGYNSLARYYYNNLHDGNRQDALDLAAGHYTVSRGISFPHEPKGLEAVAHLPLASALIAVGAAITTMSLSQAPQSMYHLMLSLICGSLTAGLVALVRSNGHLFCNRPHLSKLF